MYFYAELSDINPPIRNNGGPPSGEYHDHENYYLYEMNLKTFQELVCVYTDA